jgi:hypothetical protein
MRTTDTGRRQPVSLSASAGEASEHDHRRVRSLPGHPSALTTPLDWSSS